jgi:DNA-binding beta-propeller fold protein YncE
LIYNRALLLSRTDVGKRSRGVGLRQVLESQAEDLGLVQASQIRQSGRLASRFGIVFVTAAAALAVSGCGNTYRPVVAAINPVGPAAQPTKYAVAISSPSQTPVSGPTSFVGAWSASATYSVNQAVSYQGLEYVSLTNGNTGQDPATQTAAWTILSNGLATIVDFSGDTVLITASLGVNPYFFVLNSSGTTGYTLNSDKTVNSFDISTQLLSSDVLETTLLPGAAPVSILPVGGTTYIADPGLNQVDELTGTPPALKQGLPVGPNPVWVAGASGAARAYVLSAGDGTGAGQAAALEITDNTISANLTVGRGPVYGLMSADLKRAYILNKGDGTVSVINVVQNTLDSTAPTIRVGTAPIWADTVTSKNELVVANQGDGTSNGSASIISVPLCSASVLPNNPNCDPTNPVDASSFGTVLATVPVGQNPIMVAALGDGTRAYVANAGVAGLPCAVNGIAVPGVSTTCTISVVNLTSNTVTATIPISGHPVYIAATTGTPTGKVYVVCNDSPLMTVIETDTDTVETTIPLQGFGVSVRVTKP